MRQQYEMHHFLFQFFFLLSCTLRFYTQTNLTHHLTLTMDVFSKGTYVIFIELLNLKNNISCKDRPKLKKLLKISNIELYSLNREVFATFWCTQWFNELAKIWRFLSMCVSLKIINSVISCNDCQVQSGIK